MFCFRFHATLELYVYSVIYTEIYVLGSRCIIGRTTGINNDVAENISGTFNYKNINLRK